MLTTHVTKRWLPTLGDQGAARRGGSICGLTTEIGALPTDLLTESRGWCSRGDTRATPRLWWLAPCRSSSERPSVCGWTMARHAAHAFRRRRPCAETFSFRRFRKLIRRPVNVIASMMSIDYACEVQGRHCRGVCFISPIHATAKGVTR
jgi:hypothetical protein